MEKIDNIIDQLDDLILEVTRDSAIDEEFGDSVVGLSHLTLAENHMKIAITNLILAMESNQ